MGSIGATICIGSLHGTHWNGTPADTRGHLYLNLNNFFSNLHVEWDKTTIAQYKIVITSQMGTAEIIFC